MTRAAVTALGLKLYAPDASGSAATAVLAPEGVDSGVFVKELKSRFAAIITNGQGEMKGKIFRKMCIRDRPSFSPRAALQLINLFAARIGSQ